MTSRHLVDPELLPALDMIPPGELSLAALPALRAQITEMSARQRASLPPVPGIERREVLVPATAGAPDVRVLAYTHTAGGDPRPAYLHIHGGGYVRGNADMSEPRNMALARELDCVVASVDYRLAPETRFPGNVEDCYVALKWLHAHAAELGVNPSRVAIGGESAGGGLAAALALLARDRGEVPIIHQQLIQPMIDDRSAVADRHPYTGEFVWTRERNRFGWRALLGCEPGGDGISAYAAAARAERLDGLPSAFISVGALDLFVEESVTYALRLNRAGVPVELHVYPGAFHGSDMAAEARISKTHAQDQLAALRAAFARTR